MLLLELCAYLAPEPIPLDLFTAHAGSLPAPLAAAAADPLAFSEVIGDPGGLLAGQADPGRAAAAPARSGRHPRPARRHPPAARTQEARR